MRASRQVAGVGNRNSSGISGAGGISHLNIEFMKVETGGNFTHIAYKGAAPGVADVGPGLEIL